MMRGMGMVPGANRKQLLTSNGKFLAFPTPSNGVIFLSMASIAAKMAKRVGGRSFS